MSKPRLGFLQISNYLIRQLPTLLLTSKHLLNTSYSMLFFWGVLSLHLFPACTGKGERLSRQGTSRLEGYLISRGQRSSGHQASWEDKGQFSVDGPWRRQCQEPPKSGSSSKSCMGPAMAKRCKKNKISSDLGYTSICNFCQLLLWLP